MLSKVITAGLNGIDAYEVAVETDISRGLPAFVVVGLPSVTVKEAKERVRAAILNSGYDFPVSKITVNLSPAGNRKEGSYFDLPMALGVLATDDTNNINLFKLGHYGIMGELALDGQVKHIDGALPLAIGLRKSGVTKIMLPWDNIPEVRGLEGIEVFPVSSLREAVLHFNNEEVILPLKPGKEAGVGRTEYDCDFSEVKGQEVAKRALVISVSGGHGIYLHGFPGSGKSMLAKRIPTIMPQLSYEEMLEITMIYSVAGKLSANSPIIEGRPFRAPHHSITRAALMGGERPPKPGEVSLAHRGVLFLDEFPEFTRETLETLRQPVEDGRIVIQRGESSVTFPCEFILVAAGNPCKCGYHGSKLRECTCSMGEIQRYQSKLSGPLIDRIDMQIGVAELHAGKLLDEIHHSCAVAREKCMDSETMREMVQRARDIQHLRYGNSKKLNAHLEGEDIARFCKMDKEAEEMIKLAVESFGLSMRSCSKIIKVARTIADIEDSELIKKEHTAEALQYRALDRMKNVRKAV